MAEKDEASSKDEFGDLLFALVNFGRHLDIDAEAALAGTNEKFRRRFHFVERALAEQGRTLRSRVTRRHGRIVAARERR